MKNKQPTKKSIGKISRFLKSMTLGGSMKAFIRRSRRTPNSMPSSNKVGKGVDNTQVVRNYIVSEPTHKQTNMEKREALNRSKRVAKAKLKCEKGK